jgi:8-oxo-dGTP pyrophosphatase MutT (NUDIX family)
VLRAGPQEVELLLLERAERASDPASGQVGLPGGHVEQADPSLAAAALRELREEVGLDKNDLGGPPRLFSIRRASRFGLDVGIFAAELAVAPRTFKLNPEEVREVFWLPRSALRLRESVIRESPIGSIEVDATLYAGHVVWGFTLRVLDEFFRWWDGAPPP